MIRSKIVLVLLMGVLVLVGCGGKEEAAEPAAAEPEAMAEPMATEAESASLHAMAALQSKEGFTVSGSLHFEQSADGGPVTIVAEIQGAPAGSRGLHIHEAGDCSSADFKSAGGHFNPAGVAHAGPADAERHSGDLGNIEIGEDGSGTLTLTSDIVTLTAGEPTSIVGLGVILHEGTDDLVSQPTGDAGGRIGCGVIEAVDG
jgi:Cu-Zn family superoxide dismutase